MTKTQLIILAVPLGLVVGSFLTMVIDRVPEHMKLFRPGPRCPHCEARIPLRHLVPVVSYLQLRGRCGHCQEKFTVAYPLVEVVTAGAFATAAWRFGVNLEVIGVWLFFATLIAVSVVDLFMYIIPDRIIFPMLAVLIGFMALLAWRNNDGVLFQQALTGMALYAALLALPFFLRPNAARVWRCEIGVGHGPVRGVPHR